VHNCDISCTVTCYSDLVFVLPWFLGWSSPGEEGEASEQVVVEDGSVDHLQDHPHPQEVDGSADPKPTKTQQDHQRIPNNSGDHHQDHLHLCPDLDHPHPYQDPIPLVVEVL